MTVRQLSDEQAQLLAAMAEIGLRDPQAGSDEVARLRRPGEFAADQAAAACARIEDLARAAKRAGYRGWIGPLRADIYVGLLEGRWQHLTRAVALVDARQSRCEHRP